MRRSFLPCGPWSLLLRVMVLLLQVHAHFHWRIRVCFVLRVCNLRGVCSQSVAANEPYTHPSFLHRGLSSLLRQMTTLLIHLHTHFPSEILITLSFTFAIFYLYVSEKSSLFRGSSSGLPYVWNLFYC